MAKADEKVMAAVEAALSKDPNASVNDLFAMAKGISSGVGKLTKRQFHARYPLQVKRKLKPAGKRKARSGKKAAKRGRKAVASLSSRDAVRAVFLQFASDLAAAESRKDVVRVVADVDRYVEDTLKAAGSKK